MHGIILFFAHEGASDKTRLAISQRRIIRHIRRLFAALQLDDWRQQREIHEAETRYLERLWDDLQTKEKGVRSLLSHKEK